MSSELSDTELKQFLQVKPRDIREGLQTLITPNELIASSNVAFNTYTRIANHGTAVPVQQASFRATYESQSKILDLLTQYYENPSMPTHGAEFCTLVMGNARPNDRIRLELWGQLAGLPFYRFVNGRWVADFDASGAAQLARLFPAGSRERVNLSWDPGAVGVLVGNSLSKH